MCLYINKWPNPALGHCSAAAHGEIAWARGKQPGQRELICLHHLQGTQGEVPGTARVHIHGQTGGWAWIRAQEPGKQNSELAQARGAVSGELQDTCNCPQPVQQCRALLCAPSSAATAVAGTSLCHIPAVRGAPSSGMLL